MDYSTYISALNSIEEKAPIESGVQALIYMLVFEILQKETFKKQKQLDIVIIDKMQNHSVFMSYGGISDIAIVDKGFSYNENDRTKIKMCIEVKFISENIKRRKFKNQVLEQLFTYKKAIITNGKEWHFYELKTSTNFLDVHINKVIANEQKLAIERRELKSLCLQRTNLVKWNGRIEAIEEIEKEINEKNSIIENISKELIDERNKIDKANIEYLNEECIIDDKASFDVLCDKIKDFLGVASSENDK